MLEFRKAATDKATITVELFGTARMICGQRCVSIEATENAVISDVTAALARTCPELVGKVIHEDLSRLVDSFTFNLNGTQFVSEGALRLKPGDRLLLFSSQAGG